MQADRQTAAGAAARGGPGSGAAAQLDRSLGLTETLAIVINRIIGSGIFRTPGPIMALTGCVSLFFGAWVVAGIATLLGAFCYAELVAMLPRSGGPYVYLKEAYGAGWAFLRGWAMFFVSETGAVAAVALVCAEYGNALVAQRGGAPLPRAAEVAIALGVVWAHTAANCFGVRMAGALQSAFSLVKVLALGAVIGVGFSRLGETAASAGAPGAAANGGLFAGTPFWPSRFDWATIVAAGGALRYAFFAYSGWEGATYVAEEVREPSRNLPRSIILGICGVMLLYLAANAAYLHRLPGAQIAQAKWVAADAMRAALGAAGGMLIALAVVVNTFGNVSSQVLVKARTWHAMARDGLFPAPLARLHPRYRTPNTALVVQGAWASVLLVAAGFAAHSYETIIDYFSFTSAVFNVSTFAAVWVLRRRLPSAARPYRAWGYPISLIVVLLVQLWLMLATLITAPIPSLLGIGLTSTGFLYYHRGRLVRRRAGG